MTPATGSSATVTKQNLFVSLSEVAYACWHLVHALPGVLLSLVLMWPQLMGRRQRRMLDLKTQCKCCLETSSSSATLFVFKRCPPQASSWWGSYLCDAPEWWIKCPLQVVNAWTVPLNAVCTGVIVAASLRRCRHLQCEQALFFFFFFSFSTATFFELSRRLGRESFHMSNLHRSMLFLVTALPFHYNKQYPQRFPSTGKMDT